MAASKTRKPSSKNNDNDITINGTRLELTLAAEKVFALNGLRGATLRQIREEAGQKNESVIHYHFGSREAIIESILHLRSKPLDEARLTLLEAVREETNGGPLSALQVARCCILPLARFVLDEDHRPGYYMRFLVQLRGDRAAWRQFSGLHDQGLNQSVREMRSAMPYLPTSILDQRFVSMMYMHLNGMAAIEQIQSEKGADFNREEAWVRVEDLITTATAVMESPLSPATVAAIQSACRVRPLPTYTDVSLYREQDAEEWPLRP